MDAIRLAIAGLLKDYKSGLLAKKLGDLNPSTLYKWAEPSTEQDRHSEIPLRRAIQLTLITSDTRLMDAIAGEAGGTFIPGRHLVEGKFRDEKCAMAVLSESAELIRDYTAAINDGKVTDSELREICRVAAEAHLAIACIVELAKERAGA